MINIAGNRRLTMTSATILPILLLVSPSSALSQDEANSLTVKEARAGWILLFDGKTTEGWHTFNSTGVNPRWHVEHGELTLDPSSTRKVSGADLETAARFGDFELTLEWKISPGGNSGIFYRADGHSYQHPWEVAPEYQLLDNTAGNDPPIHQAGAVWDFYPPVRDVTRPLGEFNYTRILVRHNHVEHWMNGEKLLSYELGSKDFKARHSRSAFRQNQNFATAARGTIVLQDEGRLVSFRNIKIRSLD